MAGRPPLPLGTHGAVRYYPHPDPTGKHWRATTKFRDLDGHTRAVSRIGKSKAAADRALKAALLERRGGHEDTHPDTRFKVLAEVWLAAVERERAVTTYDTYRRQLRNRVLPALGELQLRECTVPVVDRYLRAMEGDLGPYGVRTCRSIVSGVLGLAVRQGAIPANPVRDTGRIQGSSPAARALTAGERHDLFLRLDQDERARRDDLPDLFRFLVGTGLRIGEALGLQWWRLDLERREFVAGPVLVRGAGRGLMLNVKGKTRSSLRVVPLPDFVYWMLRTRFDGQDPLTPVFPNGRGGWRDPNNTQRSIRKARVVTGYEWLTSHVFRKTAITIMDEEGLTPREIAGAVGHARPSITMDTYMDLRSRGRGAADALERAMGSPDGAR